MRLCIANGIVFRVGYYVAMYTGLRAAVNRVRGALLPRPQTAILHGRRLSVNHTESVLIRVHARQAPDSSAGDLRAGMISVQLVDPGIAWPLYALLRLTSHFGCGHIEIAFYETDDSVVVYAIRNIVQANATRIGCVHLLNDLTLCDESDEVLLLKSLQHLLGNCGLQTALAAPDDCVKYAVDDRLLRPGTRKKTRTMLRKKYSRIWQRAQTPCDPGDTEDTGSNTSTYLSEYKRLRHA